MKIKTNFSKLEMGKIYKVILGRVSQSANDQAQFCELQCHFPCRN